VTRWYGTKIPDTLPDQIGVNATSDRGVVLDRRGRGMSFRVLNYESFDLLFHSTFDLLMNDSASRVEGSLVPDAQTSFDEFSRYFFETRAPMEHRVVKRIAGPDGRGDVSVSVMGVMSSDALELEVRVRGGRRGGKMLDEVRREVPPRGTLVLFGQAGDEGGPIILSLLQFDATEPACGTVAGPGISTVEPNSD
jgi:hypothetical protein